MKRRRSSGARTPLPGEAVMLGLSPQRRSTPRVAARRTVRLSFESPCEEDRVALMRDISTKRVFFYSGLDRYGIALSIGNVEGCRIPVAFRDPKFPICFLNRGRKVPLSRFGFDALQLCGVSCLRPGSRRMAART